MILLRMRKYGSADWTTIDVEGELEEQIALLLGQCIYDVEGNAVQVRRPEETDWSELKDFGWMEED